MTENIWNRPLVIYHANCRDGFCAAWVAHQYFTGIGVEAEYVAAQYATSAPQDVDGRDVLVLDFSYPKPIMVDILQRASRLIVLDHHKTAQEALEGLTGGDIQFDMTRSGAGMTWDFLFYDKKRPILVDYVEDRDLWAKKLDRSDEVTAAIGTIPFEFEAWTNSLSTTVDEWAIQGSAVLKKIKQYVAEVLKNQRTVRFAGHLVPIVNAPQVDISELLAHLVRQPLKETGKLPPFAMGWWQRGDGKYQYSLRSIDYDVSKLAQKWGGGGHKQAAGFQLETPIAFKHLVHELSCLCGGEGWLWGHELSSPEAYPTDTRYPCDQNPKPEGY